MDFGYSLGERILQGHGSLGAILEFCLPQSCSVFMQACVMMCLYVEIMSYKYPKTGDNYAPLAFLFEIFFPPDYFPGFSTPIVISLFWYTVLASPFLDKKALNLALKCTFQYILPVLTAMVNETFVNH